MIRHKKYYSQIGCSQVRTPSDLCKLCYGLLSSFSGNIRRFRRICEHTQSVVSVIRRQPPPSSPRAQRRATAAPNAASKASASSSSNADMSESSSCSSDISDRLGERLHLKAGVGVGGKVGHGGKDVSGTPTSRHMTVQQVRGFQTCAILTSYSVGEWRYCSLHLLHEMHKTSDGNLQVNLDRCRPHSGPVEFPMRQIKCPKVT